MSNHVRNIQDVVEREIARWRAEQGAPGEPRAAPKPRPRIITMSHAVASGGEEIARLVGRTLGVPVYDREIVRHIAETAEVHRAVVETLDEHALSRVEQHIGTLLTGEHFDRGDYLRFLSRTVCALWEHGPCVITGHGSVHLVPRTHALAVRTTAAREDRERRLAEREHLGPDEAARRLREADEERAAFHRKYFDASASDPDHYDLVLNTSSLSLSACAALVVQAYESKLGWQH